MNPRVAHRRPVPGSSQATEPAGRGQRSSRFLVSAVWGPDQPSPLGRPPRTALASLQSSCRKKSDATHGLQGTSVGRAVSLTSSQRV